MLKGIDISRWQGQINWPMVKSNVDFAIIKIGGSDDGFYTDGMAQRNVIEARSAGIPIWFYVYLGGAFSVGEEVQHIKNLVGVVGGLKPGETVCLDWEERRAGHDEVGYLTGIVDGLASAGFPPPPIYMNLNYVRTQDWSNLVRRNCALWVAAWGNNDAIPEQKEVPESQEWPFWSVWQFSSTGSVPGINGRVDLNRFNGDINQFKQYGSNVSIALPAQVNIPVAPANGSGFTEYTVVRGDTLSSIAGKFGQSWQSLWALNRDRVSNPNRIFTGQNLKVWSAQVGNPQIPQQPQQNQNRVHTVENGENLSVIAAKYGISSWRAIYDRNRAVIGDNPNLIKPGQRLEIP
jgi:lysozyme